MWEDDWDVDVAPWRSPESLISRIRGWLELTDNGWPGDESCDLERYLPSAGGRLVVYDSGELAKVDRQCAKIQIENVVRITAETRKLPSSNAQRIGRRDKNLAWIQDIGEVIAPVENWRSIATLLGEYSDSVSFAIRAGLVKYIALRYTHGSNSSVLVVQVAPSAGSVISVVACESADENNLTRTLRAGRGSEELATSKVAIVGCGAIGSFVADQLFRAGVRHILLVDHEVLRPGNVIRHLAGTRHVGMPKPEAVLWELAELGASVANVETNRRGLFLPAEATRLVADYDVVVDATASATVTGMLSTAASNVPGTVIAVCVQREGGVARVDRFPVRTGETYLPPLAPLPEQDPAWEAGCGSPVSRTPPVAVASAANLASTAVLEQLRGTGSLPASFALVREPQVDVVEFSRRGWVEA